MDATTLRPALTPEDEAELAASMSRHPAGKRMSHLCPTCGQSPAGNIGLPAQEALVR